MDVSVIKILKIRGLYNCAFRNHGRRVTRGRVTAASAGRGKRRQGRGSSSRAGAFPPFPHPGPGPHRARDTREGTGNRWRCCSGGTRPPRSVPVTGKDLRTREIKNFRKWRGGWRSLVGRRGESPGERRRGHFPPKRCLLPLPAKVTSNPVADAKTKAPGLINSYQPGSFLLPKNQPLGFIVPVGKAPVEHGVTQTAGGRGKERTLLSGERRVGRAPPG